MSHKRKKIKSQAHLPQTPLSLEANPKNTFGQYAVVIAFVICLASFFVHLYGADYQRRKSMTTVDESVYSRLGLQLKIGQEYNTIQMYQENLKMGRKLPDYFKDPLFKHPPMFPFLISLSYMALPKKNGYSFEEMYALASKVSNLMGCLLIFITFLIARELFDDRIGLLAALILSMEMNLLICSQKVWMESTLAFFFWLSLYFFYKGLKKPWFLILSAAACALALLTKYPAVLLLLIFLTMIVCFERKLLKSIWTYLGAVVLFVILIPWINLNLETYGKSFINTGKIGTWATSMFDMFLKIIGFFLVAVIAAAWLKWKKPEIYHKIRVSPQRRGEITSVVLGVFVLALFIFPDMREGFVTSMRWNAFSWSGWEMHTFDYEPRYFYLKHILEFSPFYLFFLIALISAPLGRRPDHYLLVIVFWTLAFTTIYGNFQGRYILYFAPAAIILAAKTIVDAFDYILKEKNVFRYSMASIFAGALVYFLARTIQISLHHAIFNNVAYY